MRIYADVYIRICIHIHIHMFWLKCPSAASLQVFEFKLSNLSSVRFG